MPYILIEVFMEGDDLAHLEGDGSSDKGKFIGFFIKIVFDEKYQGEYEDLVKTGNIKTLPIEYHNIS